VSKSAILDEYGRHFVRQGEEDSVASLLLCVQQTYASILREQIDREPAFLQRFNRPTLYGAYGETIEIPDGENLAWAGEGKYFVFPLDDNRGNPR